MGTPCSIAYEYPDGKIDIIKCNFDGYLNGGVGEMLKTHYQNPRKTEVLFRKGNISRLGSIPYSKPEYWDSTYLMDHQDIEEEITIAYADRGDDPSDCMPLHFVDEEEYLLRFHSIVEEMYNYLWRDGQWYVVDEDKMPTSDLEQYLSGDKTLDMVPALIPISAAF